MEVNIEKGIITRIAVKNFVTYDEVVVKPGKNLNLIIGANGTGKSTIVCAIVLGLGGNPKVIGRQTQIGHYVKAGHKNASIEIDLQNGHNKFITVKRMFDLENKTTWMVNNKPATSKQISDLMNSFNIQVNNLCQFLPQDKVQDFSNLTSHDLLTETERSVGDPRLIEYHTKLKEMRIKQSTLEKELESKSKLQLQEKQTYDSLKDSVGHIKEQQSIKKKLKSLKQKKAWIIYQNRREELGNAKKDKDKAKAKKNKIQKKLEPVQEEIAKLKSSIQALEKTAKQHSNETSAKVTKLNKFLDDIENQEKVVDEIAGKCESKIRDEQTRDENINQSKQQKNKLENDLNHLINNVGTVESIHEQFDQTTPTLDNHKRSLSDLKSRHNYLKVQIDDLNRKIRGEEQNLQAVQDIENKRFDVLRKLSSDAYKGVLWLRENQHLFSKPVHEPMLLQINLKDASYSKYFENIIPQRDLTAFVCEDKNDMNMLLRYLRDQQKLKINAIHSDPNKEVNYQPTIPLNQIQQFGFENYLISLIEAPRTILNYLVGFHRLNDIPIGKDSVASNLDYIPDYINRFFTYNNSYFINRSKYTNEKSTRQAPIASRGILSITVDADKMSQIQQKMSILIGKKDELTEESNNFQEKYAVIHAKIEAVKEIRSKLQTNLTNIQNLQVRINMANKTIEDLQNDRRSIDEIRAQYKTEIQVAIKRQLQIYRQYNKMFDDCYKNNIISEEMKLGIKLKKNILAQKEHDSQELREEFAAAEREYKLLENELRPLLEDVEKLYCAAKESTGGLDYQDPNFDPIKKAFAKLPASIEDIMSEIQTTQAKIFCLNNDQSEANRILEKFNTAKRNLEKLNTLIEQRDEELKKVTEEIEEVREVWYPMLRALVEKINSNFSNYFTKMKCAGEVSISQADNPMDFDKYGLKIKVKFRDADELQTLTRNHQSGGERAVTTAVYMIALQELTRVPFRCVDEINQGMDATNERRVFELIVDITSKKDSAQYFLLTPKLLPDLNYNDSVTVLTIFNGPFMVPSTEFDIVEQFDGILNNVIRRYAS